MATPGWTVSTEGSVALVAATAKTVLNVVAPAGKTVTVCGFSVAFDGTSASAAPVTIELMRASTLGTSTSVTVRRKRGDSASTFAGTAGKNHTVEPTTPTPVEDYWIDPNKGVFVMQYPLGREADGANSTGLLLRLTAAAGVNCRATMEVEIN